MDGSQVSAHALQRALDEAGAAKALVLSAIVFVVSEMLGTGFYRI